MQDHHDWNPEMTSLFEDLDHKLRQYLPPEQVEEVARAYAFAYKAHDGQKRSSGEPYITHPIAVATILADMHLDREAVIAAILHDVVEDTPVTEEDIKNIFGKTVSDLVNGVTKMEKIRFSNYKEAQVANIQKMLLAMTNDTRVILIKLADRTHNMRTIGALRPDKRKRIARETLDIYAPIAYRLGISSMKNELQNLCFRAIFPHRYEIISRVVKEGQKNRQETYDELIAAMDATMKKTGIRFKIRIRQKSLATIYHKMTTEHIDLPTILNVFSFAIVVDSVDSCYRTLGQMHNLFKPKQGYFKDYVALPKLNGYQGLHTTVIAPGGLELELHIRTEYMDVMAENGVAAHWVYRIHNNQAANDSQTQFYANKWMQSLKELMSNTTTSFEFLENVKANLFPEEIYLFAGDSQVLELPKGSTPVDFAYAISARLGNHCIGAEVDHKEFPLDKPLSSGQQVHIIEGATAFAQPQWLESVVTLKARREIRKFLESMSTVFSEEQGRCLLQKALGHKKICDLDTNHINMVLERTHLKNINELFRSITLGEFNAHLVAQGLLGPAAEADISDTKEKDAISGVSGINYRYATCCYPLPGDEVCGIFDKEKGILEIHRKDCHCAKDLLAETPEKFIPVKWNKDFNGETPFRTSLIVSYQNRQSILGEIVSLISLTKTEIISITQGAPDTKRNAHTIEIIIEIKDLEQLSQVTNTLNKINSIESVVRKPC